VDKSVEKPGSFTLSARSVSGPIQIGEKPLEIEIKHLKSMGYNILWIGDEVSVANVAMEVIGGVRKSLILRGPEGPGGVRPGCRSCRSTPRSQAFIQGMPSTLERTRYAAL
jgi:hypothetical protein